MKRVRAAKMAAMQAMSGAGADDGGGHKRRAVLVDDVEEQEVDEASEDEECEDSDDDDGGCSTHDDETPTERVAEAREPQVRRREDVVKVEAVDMNEFDTWDHLQAYIDAYAGRTYQVCDVCLLLALIEVLTHLCVRVLAVSDSDCNANFATRGSTSEAELATRHVPASVNDHLRQDVRLHALRRSAQAQQRRATEAVDSVHRLSSQGTQCVPVSVSHCQSLPVSTVFLANHLWCLWFMQADRHTEKRMNHSIHVLHTESSCHRSLLFALSYSFNAGTRCWHGKPSRSRLYCESESKMYRVCNRLLDLAKIESKRDHHSVWPRASWLCSVRCVSAITRNHIKCRGVA